MLNYAILNHLSASRVDWVGDVRVELGPSVTIGPDTALFLPCPARVAKPSFEMVLGTTFVAVSREFSTGHRYEWTGISRNNLKVANHETVVKGDAAESTQPILGICHKLDTNFSYLHDESPCSIAGMAFPRNPGQFCAKGPIAWHEYNARLGDL